jgi:hypothetical protein
MFTLSVTRHITIIPNTNWICWLLANYQEFILSLAKCIVRWEKKTQTFGWNLQNWMDWNFFVILDRHYPRMELEWQKTQNLYPNTIYDQTRTLMPLRNCEYFLKILQRSLEIYFFKQNGATIMTKCEVLILVNEWNEKMSIYLEKWKKRKKSF